MTKSISHGRKPRNTVRKIHFQSVPEVGTVIDYYGYDLTLIEIRDYIRKDGTPSVILVWKRADGILGTSGLSSNGLSYASEGNKNV